MKFLIEKLILSDEEFNHYGNLNTTREKLRFIDNFLNNHPNYKNLRGSLSIYSESLIEDGFDTLRNPFIYFLENININPPFEVVSLIKTLVDQNKLDTKNKYLYYPSLYSENIDKTLEKIKILTLASNKGLQKNLNKELNVEMLLDESGNFLKLNDMYKILSVFKSSSGKLDTKEDNEIVSDALDVLTSKSMGMTKKDALYLINQVYNKDMSLEELLTAVFKVR